MALGLRYLVFVRKTSLLVLALAGCASGKPFASDAGVRPSDATVPYTTETPCRTDAECGAGLECSVIGLCVATGRCAHDMDCGEGFACDIPTGACAPGSACGASEFESTRITPNVLVVLDRSCSMTGAANPGQPRTKWEAAVSALSALSTAHDQDVRWGLITFPDPGGDRCSQNEVAVTAGDGTGQAMRAVLASSLSASDALYPDGPCVTNIDAALMQAAAQPVLADPAHPGYVLFVSDGAQEFCGNLFGADERSLSTIQSMSTAGVSTFVVGFGRGIDGAALSTFARAGGRPREGNPPYHQADDEAALVSALDAIVQGVVTCDFALATEPPVPDEIFVFFDDVRRVDRDTTHVNGWDYDSAGRRVTLFGAACDDLKRGTVSDVDIVYGCPQPFLE